MSDSRSRKTLDDSKDSDSPMGLVPEARRSSKALSRRGFLGASVATAAAGAVGSMALAGCSDEESRSEGPAWDREVDLVIIGSGTGLVGGLVAATSGAEVLVMEKRAIAGGSTGHSGGVAWIPNNDFMRAEGIHDSRENALVYLKHLAQRQADPDLLEAFVDAGREMANFVQEHSSIRWRVSTIMGNSSDYHPEWPGAVQRGRSIEPIVDRKGLFGPELIEALRRGYEDAGGELLLETPAHRLVLRDMAEGRREVIGIEARREGKPYFVKARRGVQLAAGGYDWDFKMKQHFLRGPTIYTLGAGGNTGDGIRMAMAAGADLRNMNEVWGITVYKGEAEPIKKYKMGATLNAEIEKRSAGSIVVNSRGERFQNEAADYGSTWRSYHEWENYGELRYHNLPAYVLFDSKVRQNGRIAGVSADGVLPDWVIEAPSLSDLAERAGIDAEGLARTVARFNVYAKELRDPDYTRGESSYDRYGQAEKSITLGPLDEAPFFAAEIAPADLGTCGGARVNAHAQVLDPFGVPIGGLYASGNNAGIGSPGSSYGGGGGTIGPAMTFSFVAGRHAMSQSLRS